MPTKADHNRNHLFIVHSPSLASPLCTGWRQEDHAARPQGWHGSAFLPFFAQFSNRKGNLCRLTSLCGRRRDLRLPVLCSFFERAECLAVAYSRMCLGAAGPFGFDWRLLTVVYCILEQAFRPSQTKILKCCQWVHRRSWVLRQSQANQTSRKKPMRP